MLSKIKLVLAERGMTQVDLAFELHISPSTLSEIINERRCADPATRRQIAKRLSADEAWLFSKIIQIPKQATPRGSEETSGATLEKASPRDGF